MDGGEIVLILGAVLLLVAGVIIAFMIHRKIKKGEAREPNYRAFFILGISFIPIGCAWIVIALSNEIPPVTGIPFLGLGVIYMAIGLANRDKWKK